MTHEYQGESEARQRQLFEQVLERSRQAMEASGILSVYLRLAEKVIRLDFAGDAMVKATTAALQHLVIDAPESPVDAVFNIWDSASTGVENVKPPWKNNQYSDRGDIWGFNSRRYLSSFHWGDYGLNLFDTDTHTGIYWTQDATNLPYWSKAAPLRTLFHWLMRQYGLQLMHAAAVGNHDGAILITGRGGIGKSGTALSCLLAGMQFIGDDYLVVGLDPDPRVYPLYSSAKVNWGQLHHYPGLEKQLLDGVSHQDEKVSVALMPHFEQQIPSSLPLRLVVTPKFHEQPGCELTEVSSDLLKGAATLTSVSQLPHGGQGIYRFVEAMIRRVPAATLLLGHDRRAIPSAITELLRPPIKSRVCHNYVMAGDVVAGDHCLPLITVIIPVYNGAQFLPDAIRNVQDQGYPALEVIVVDDGSTDELAAVVRELPMEVRYLRQANRGPGAARNLGIKNAAGDFFAFLDVDDLWPEDNLHILARYLLAHPEPQVVRGVAQCMHLDPSTGRYQHVGNPLESFADSIAAALFRRQVFTTVGLFDQTFYYGEDTDWFERCRGLGITVTTLDLVTLFVRRHGRNMTEGKNLSALHKLQLLKKHLDQGRTANETALSTD